MDQQHDAGQPKEKVRKLHALEPNPAFKDKKFSDCFDQEWTGQGTTPSDNNLVFSKPFQIAVLENFVNSSTLTTNIVKEMVEEVEWNRKQMDLFEFFQSTDISNLRHCPTIFQFYEFLMNEAKPLVEKLTKMKFTNLTATCSMYTRGDYLLVHDDLLSNRRIAFVYYISPWKDAKEWSEEMGGSLEIFETDENDLPQFPVVRKISPKDNQFVFFKVGRKSFHQVGEVTCSDFPRITINGWFYGDEVHPENPFDKISSDTSFSIKKPLSNSNLDVINANYLSTSSKAEIQSQIEDNSEIKLDKFFSEELVLEVLNELKNSKSWKVKGPAISQYYEYLDLTNVESSSILRKFVDIFKSKQFIELIHEYTELDIYGSNAKSPKLSLEVQKWNTGCYSILGDIGSDEDALDLLFYFNEADNVGNVTYINNEEADDDDDEDSILLTVESCANAMNIIYRTSQQIRFVKYISKNKPLPDGPVFILSASYKE